MRVRAALVVVAVAVVAVVVSLLPGSASRAAVRAQSPYACGYCLFEMPLRGGKLRILWGNPKIAGFDDVSPSRRLVVYSRPVLGAGEDLYVANLDGSGARRLATGHDGRWSPDGKEVAYLAPRTFDPANPCDGGAVAVVAADGTNGHVIDGGCSTEPVWSADSKRLAYFAMSNWAVGRLTIASADGSERRALTPPASVEDPSQLRWSPRGDRLTFAAFPDARPASGHGVSAGGPSTYSTSDVELVETSGKLLATLANAEAPAWAADGHGFSFTHLDTAVTTGYETSDEHRAFRFASANGTGVRTLRRDRNCCSLAKWLPGGEVAYLSAGPSPKHGEETGQIFLARADISHPRQVTRLLPGGEIDNYWFAPDRSRVYFVWEFTNVD
jgi:hypothetical protein